MKPFSSLMRSLPPHRLWQLGLTLILSLSHPLIAFGQSEPLDYDLPEDALPIVVPEIEGEEPTAESREEPFSQPRANLREEQTPNSSTTLASFREPIIIFVPPPEQPEEKNQLRRSLAEILVIEAMLLPPGSSNPF